MHVSKCYDMSEIIVFYVNELIAWWFTVVQRAGCESAPSLACGCANMCGGRWLDVPNSGASLSSLCLDAALKNAPRCMQPSGPFAGPK